MTFSRILAWSGVGLLAMVFAWAALRVTQVSLRASRAGGNAGIRLTFAHYMVYESHRRYYDDVIRQYEALHPGVTVRQLDVPIRVWPAWRRTHLASEDAPDIVQMGMGLLDEQQVLYFSSLAREVAEPNPYNRGTPMEGVAWKDTFFDQLRGSGASSETFNYRILDYFGVPTYANTLRLYANLDLLRELTGTEEVPGEFDAFVTLCESLVGRSTAGGKVAPIASSEEYARNLFGYLLSRNTQRLSRMIDLERDLQTSEREAALAFLGGRWSLETPEIRNGLGLLRHLAGFHQAGFIRALREDAGFIYKQGRAAMIITGSWDAHYLLSDNRFRSGVFPVPAPRGDHPRWGAGILGDLSEAGVVPSGSFGVLRRSRHRAQAVDFLRFLTSVRLNQQFAHDCLRIPAVRGAAPLREVERFAPRTEGLEAGFVPFFYNFGSRSAKHAVDTSLNALIDPGGGAEVFSHRLKDTFRDSLERDCLAYLREGRRNLQRTDVLLAGLRRLGERGDPLARERAERLSESLLLDESDLAQVAHRLAHPALP